MHREWGFARHQQDRQTTAKHVVHAHGCVGGARVYVHHHRLAPPGDCGKTCGHVNGHVFMGTQNNLGVRSAFLVPLGQGLDQGDVVSAKVGEDVLDA